MLTIFVSSAESFAFNAHYQEKIKESEPFNYEEVGAQNFWQKEAPHPYFGFQLTPKWADLHNAALPNNYGFLNPVDFPYKKKATEYVIGFFGSSLTLFFVADMLKTKYFETRIKEKIPSLKDKDIVLLNFGLGGAKQPQQFIISSFFYDSVDFIINIDGFADIVLEAPSNYPPEFPISSDFLYGEKNQSLPYIAKIQWYRSLPQHMSTLAMNFRPLSYSSAYYLLTKILSAWVNSKVAQLKLKVRDLLQSRSEPFPERDHSFYGRSATWNKFTWLQHELLKALNIPHLFFIQPTLGYKYSPTTEEAKHLIGKEGITPLYREFDVFVDLQKKKGLPIVPLFDLFEDTNHVYLDVVHLNKLGHKILANAIIDRLKFEIAPLK